MLAKMNELTLVARMTKKKLLATMTERPLAGRVAAVALIVMVKILVLNVFSCVAPAHSCSQEFKIPHLMHVCVGTRFHQLVTCA